MATTQTSDSKPTSSPTEWQWIPRMHRDTNGRVCVAFPPPRGPLSFVALAVSGLVLAVSGLGTIMVLAADLQLPAALTATLLISAVTFAGFVIERQRAKSRAGLWIKLVPADQGNQAFYEVYRGKSMVEREALSPGTMALTTTPLPGRVGALMLPTFALVLFPRQAEAQYSAEIAGKPGYVLLHGDLRFPEQLYQRTRQICSALGVELEQSVTVEASLISNSNH